MTEYVTETARLEERITTALQTIRSEWDHMLPTTAPAVRLGGGSRAVGITQSRETTPAADYYDTNTPDVDATTRLVSLRREVAQELNTWCRVILEDKILPSLESTNKSQREIDTFLAAILPNGSDVSAMTVFLERNARWLSGHHGAADAADRIGGCGPGCEARTLLSSHSCKGLVQRIQRHTPPPIADKPRPPKPHLIGTCHIEWEAPDDEGRLVMRECGGKVLAYPTGLEDPTLLEQRAMKQPTCQRCGTEAHVDWWYRGMYDDAEVSHLVTVEELIGVIYVRLHRTVTRGQIRIWQYRGKIQSAGKDRKGRSLYRHADVVKAIEGEDGEMQQFGADAATPS